MARKGQKFQKYTPKIKEEILEKYSKGSCSSLLEEEYGVPKTTIRTWAFNLKHQKINGRGRPKTKNLTLEDYKERYEILKKYRAFLEVRRGKK